MKKLLILQMRPEDATADSEFVLGNVRTVVARNTNLLTGYHVDIHVDGSFVVTIYKDCNNCSLFTQSTAETRAQTYLDILQGWTR